MRKNIYKKSILAVVLFSGALANNAMAELSWFSRANCINNESISFDPFGVHTLRTQSSHYRGGVFQHCKDNLDPEFSNDPNHTCEEGTWETFHFRSAAVHWLEPINDGQWETYGVHYKSTHAGEILLGITHATDCSINSVTEFYEQFFN